MAVGGVSNIGPVASRLVQPAGDPAPAAGFGDSLQRGLQSVSQLERAADDAALSFATDGPTAVHEVMTATTKSQLATETLVAVRNRAVEAYQEIMRLQV